MSSRKLTVVMLASTVILRSLSRKILQRSFLIFSIPCGFSLKAANPSAFKEKPQGIEKIKKDLCKIFRFMYTRNRTTHHQFADKPRNVCESKIVLAHIFLAGVGKTPTRGRGRVIFLIFFLKIHRFRKK